MSAATGFAWFNLATAQTRHARDYLRSSGHFISVNQHIRDLLEWQRLKRDARQALFQSSLCDRPRLP